MNGARVEISPRSDEMSVYCTHIYTDLNPVKTKYRHIVTHLGSGSTIFLLARAAGVDLLFSIAIR